jgi:DNA-binding NarL/FixJ family response regulator
MADLQEVDRGTGSASLPAAQAATSAAAPAPGRPPVRVLIADDHPVFLAGLRTLLGAMPDIEVVGEARTGGHAISAARRLRPDLVLMDVNMPEINGIQAIRAILAERPATAVLVLTMFDDDHTVLAAVRAGARGYFLKGAGHEDILRAVSAVSRGDAIFDANVSTQVFDYLTGSAPTQPFPELTDRELAVLRLIADGRSNSEIARELSLSVKTVRNYLSRIFAKLQVTHRAEAAVKARREGLGR